MSNENGTKWRPNLREMVLMIVTIVSLIYGTASATTALIKTRDNSTSESLMLNASRKAQAVYEMQQLHAQRLTALETHYSHIAEQMDKILERLERHDRAN